MIYSDISVEDREGIRIVSLNRPETLNSIRMKTLQELDQVLAEFSKDKGARALILTGTGVKAFSAGGDIKDQEMMTVADARRFAKLAHKVLHKIETTEKPVISAVNGVALGAGCDLALACDLCIAAENAKFGLPSLNVGLITPFGGMSRMIQRVGTLSAKRLIYTGEPIGAQDAKALGLLKDVVWGSVLLDEALKLARLVLDKAPVAFAYSKRLIARNAAVSPGADDLEVEYYAKLFGTLDHKEGVRAFMEKRKPVFKGE